MKNLFNTSLAMMAISLSGCTTLPSKAQAQGRVIEFKSGAEGFDTRTFFYEAEHEVVAFDAQFTPQLAKQSIEHLRKYTKKPITWLVITHPNADKFNGASVFKSEGARILASNATARAIPGVHAYKEYFFVEMAKMFKKGEYPQPTSIDQTFDQEMDLVLRGGERIKLYELSKPGISSTQTVAHIESIQSLMVGDLIHHKAHAWLEGGIMNGKATPTIAEWIADIRELERMFSVSTIVYGGRGQTTDLATASEEQIHYLQKAQALVKTQLKSMGLNAKEFAGPNAGVLYKDLAKKFQTTFPDYKLAYMIEYGAYGLVQQELSAQ
ncbi:MAG: MBL fold metallo-hydrolase [Bdellovibrionales bacterium]